MLHQISVYQINVKLFNVHFSFEYIIDKFQIEIQFKRHVVSTVNKDYKQVKKAMLIELMWWVQCSIGTCLPKFQYTCCALSIRSNCIQKLKCLVVQQCYRYQINDEYEMLRATVSPAPSSKKKQNNRKYVKILNWKAF